MITVTAYAWVPPFAQGVVRDLRVRWALEEAGLPYKVRLIRHEDRLSAEHVARQPFGQIPTLEEDGLVLFESGAIVLHIADRSDALLPGDAAGRARAVAWLFAALNTLEGPISELATIDLFHPGEAWAAERRPDVEAAVRLRLAELAARLGEREYLEGRFTAGDLMMATVLRALRHTGLMREEPRLAAYLARCEARPAFQRALNGQMAAFEAAA